MCVSLSLIDGTPGKNVPGYRWEKRWWDMEPERRRESREMARIEIYSSKLIG